MEVSERYEQLIAYLSSQLPAPVEHHPSGDGSLQFTGGDPPEVVALLTDTSVIVSEFSGVWESAFKFTSKPKRVGLVKWRRLPDHPDRARSPGSLREASGRSPGRPGAS